MISFDAPTIMAITSLVMVIGNIALVFDARRRGIKTDTALNEVVIPQIGELHKLTNGQSQRLNAVSRALGHSEGLAEGKADAKS